MALSQRKNIGEAERARGDDQGVDRALGEEELREIDLPQPLDGVTLVGHDRLQILGAAGDVARDENNPSRPFLGPWAWKPWIRLVCRSRHDDMAEREACHADLAEEEAIPRAFYVRAPEELAETCRLCSDRR